MWQQNIADIIGVAVAFHASQKYMSAAWRHKVCYALARHVITLHVQR